MKNNNDIPKYLKKRGREFYKGVIDDFVFERIHDKERLGHASGELDIQDQAEKAIKKYGYYIKNRYGKLIENPAVKTLRDSRTLFIKIIRELGLDLISAAESKTPRRY